MIKIYRDFYVIAFCMPNKILVIDVLLHSTSMLKLELWMNNDGLKSIFMQ